MSNPHLLPSFLRLTDTPKSYTGEAGQVAAVNAAENALEFKTSFLEIGKVLDVNLLALGAIDISTPLKDSIIALIFMKGHTVTPIPASPLTYPVVSFGTQITTPPYYDNVLPAVLWERVINSDKFVMVPVLGGGPFYPDYCPATIPIKGNCRSAATGFSVYTADIFLYGFYI